MEANRSYEPALAAKDAEAREYWLMVVRLREALEEMGDLVQVPIGTGHVPLSECYERHWDETDCPSLCAWCALCFRYRRALNPKDETE